MSSSRLFGRFGPRLSHMTRGKGGVPGEIEKLRRDTELAFIDLESSAGVLPLTQFSWWIDQDNGDDNNDGATEATALKSLRELRERIGPYTLVGKEVLAYIKASVTPYPSGLDLSCRFSGKNARVRFIGVPEVIYTGAVATWTMPSSSGANGTEGELTDVGVTDWLPYEKLRIHFDPGGPNESVTFLHQHALGWVGQAGTGAAVKQRSGNSFGGVASFPVGTSYRIERLPQIPGCNCTAERLDPGIYGMNDCDTFIFENINFEMVSGTACVSVRWTGSPDCLHTAAPIFWGCRFQGADVYQTTAAFYGCGGSFIAWGGGALALRGCDLAFRLVGCDVLDIRGPEGPGAAFCPGNAHFETSRSWSLCTYGIKGTTFVRYASEVRFGECWGWALFGNPTFNIQARAWYTSGSIPKVLKGTGAANDMLIGGIGVDYAGLPYHDAVGGGGNQTDSIFAIAP